MLVYYVDLDTYKLQDIWCKRNFHSQALSRVGSSPVRLKDGGCFVHLYHFLSFFLQDTARKLFRCEFANLRDSRWNWCHQKL